MRPAGDHDAGMEAIRYIHDDVVEAIVRGDPVPDVYAPVASFAEQVRALGNAPAPQPSPELAALFATDQVTAARARRPEGSRPSGADEAAVPAGRVVGLGRMAKLSLGTSLVAAGVVGAGIAGVLPAAANDAVRGAIEVVSPVEFDHPKDKAPNFGTRVSADATGESDGENGVDGQQISEEAPGAAHRDRGASPDAPPGETGETGLTRADQTPAAPHAPDGSPSDTRPGGSVPGQPGDPDADGDPGRGPQDDRATTTTAENGDTDDESAGG